MRKRILITSTDLMMIQFLVPHVIHFSENGFEVEIACSDVGGRMEEIREKLKDYVKMIHVVRLVRSPVSLKNLTGYQDTKKVISNGNYDIIWTNEPVMGVATRLAARKARRNGTKVVYMVHGFHFFDGAPKLNWMIYYPIEKAISRVTDMIVTINREDYQRAKKMYAKDVRYIHGIGVNTSRLQKSSEQKNIRAEIGVTRKDFLILSVGELNENKNHKVVIRSLGKMQDPTIHYVICGKGEQLQDLQNIAEEEKVLDKVHFMGYRKDVVDICSQVDLFAFPSQREGLGLAALEAMYCGLALVTSRIRGLVDIMDDGISGFLCDPNNVDEWAEAIKTLKNNYKLRQDAGLHNQKKSFLYCIEETQKEVLDLFKEVKY